MKKNDIDYQQMYTDTLLAYETDGKANQYKFALIYIDEDDIPELVVKPSSTWRTASSIIYSIYDNKVCKSEFFGDYSSFSYAERKNILKSGHMVNGTDENTYINVGTLENGEIKLVKKDCSGYTFIDSDYDNVVTYYEINESSIKSAFLNLK